MEDVENDPTLWRSAVDEKTGQIYYYHKITRQSTWQKPACLCIPSQETSNDGGYDELCGMLSGLGTPEVLIELLCDEVLELRIEALQVLLTCCLPNTVYHLAATSNCINALAAIVQSTSTITSAPMLSARQQALKALCHFATDVRSAQHFVDNKSWLQLVNIPVVAKPNKSGNNTWDLESTCLLSLLYSLLLHILPSNTNLIPSQHLVHLSEQLSCNNRVDISVIASHDVDSSMSLLSTTTLLKLSSNKSDLPATLLVLLYKNILSDENEALQWLSNGAFSPLVSLCINQQISQSVRVSGSDLLSRLVATNAELRESLLASYISLATDISTLCAPQQPDPLCAATSTKAVSVSSRCDVELRPRGEGSAWRIPSTVLWTRCPGMRGVLEDYWFSDTSASPGSSGLEISVDASGEILSMLVHYIRSNILLPLVSPLVVDNECSGLLELLRVATELQMMGLVDLVVSRLLLQLRIAYQNQSTSVEGEMQQLLMLSKELGLSYLYSKLVELCNNITALPAVTVAERTTEAVRRPSKNTSSTPLQREAEQHIQHINEMFSSGDAAMVVAASDHAAPPLPEDSFEDDDYIMPTIDDHYDDTTTSYSSNYAMSRESGAKMKPKSGGIYKLLLEKEAPPAANATKPKPKTAKPKAKPTPTATKSKVKQLAMEEFIPKRHSLEPPAPEPSDAQKRMDERAKPKRVNKAGKSYIDSVAPSTSTEDTPSKPKQSTTPAKPAPSTRTAKQQIRPKTAPPATTAPVIDVASAPEVVDDNAASIPDVKASLKLLKLKSRRMVTARPTTAPSFSASADDNRSSSDTEDASVVPMTKQPATQPAVRKPTVTNSIPIDTSKCSRTSDCKCSACTIPIEALPIVTTDSITPSSTNHTTATQRIREQRSKQVAASGKPTVKTEKWRHQSEQLRQAIAASRTTTSSAPATPTPAYGMVSCPHCNRKFNEQAAERHIPICANTKARPVMLKSGSGAGGGAFAKNRK